MNSFVTALVVMQKCLKHYVNTYFAESFFEFNVLACTSSF